MVVPRPERPYADTVFRGGFVYSAGMSQAERRSIAVTDGKIAFVGPDEGALARVGPATEVIDVRERMILPGLHDAHMHPFLGAIDLQECVLVGLTTNYQYLAAVRDYANLHPQRPFIRGSGWLNGAYPPDGPRRAELDQAVPDRPVFLKSIDAHSAWVNTKALELAGITRATPDPPGGRIERHPRSGEPTGTLREPAAMSLVLGRLPPLDREEKIESMRAFLALAGRVGLTSVCEAMAGDEELEVFAALADRGELSLRMSGAWVCHPPKGAGQIEELCRAREKYHRPRLRLGAGKIFLDGVVEGHTAFLRAPYCDRPGFHGAPLWDEDEYRRMALALVREGFQIHVHAIGDAAIGLALDGIAVASQAKTLDLRHQIAHLDLLDDEDMDRLAALGVIANMQPSWFYEDENVRNIAMPFLGSERTHRLYRLHRLLERSARLACGSDWPVGGELITLNPLDAIQIAITRQALDGEGQAFLPEESVALSTLLDAYTLGGAYAAFQEEETGSLEVGKRADLVVLDRNLFAIPAGEIHRARVLLTQLDGKSVYRDPSL